MSPGDHDDRPDGRLEPDGEARQDRRRRTCDRGLRDLLHGPMLRVGEVLREHLDDARQDQSERHGEARLPGVHVGVGDHEHGDGGDDRRDEEPPVDRLHPVFLFAPRSHCEDPDDRGDHAHRSHEQREHHARDRADRRAAVCGRTQDQRCHQRDLVGLEQVRRHPGAIAHVVTDVVGDRRRVARVVLGDPLLDLPHEVGAHVGRLREDAATHPHEHGEQGAAEPEAHQHAGGVLLIDEQDHGRAEQAESHGEHPGHPAGAERDPYRAPKTGLACGVRRPDVRPDGEPHPHVAGRRAEHRAEDERERTPELDRELRVHRVLRCRKDEEEDHGQDAQEDRERPELAREVGLRPLLDRLGDLLHLLGALRRSEHLADQVISEQEGDQRDAHGHPQERVFERPEYRWIGPLSWAKTPCIEPPRDVWERASLTRPGRERVKYRGKVHARDLRILPPREARARCRSPPRKEP